jgi:hypothetical protein
MAAIPFLSIHPIPPLQVARSVSSWQLLAGFLIQSYFSKKKNCIRTLSGDAPTTKFFMQAHSTKEEEYYKVRDLEPANDVEAAKKKKTARIQHLCRPLFF